MGPCFRFKCLENGTLNESIGHPCVTFETLYDSTWYNKMPTRNSGFAIISWSGSIFSYCVILNSAVEKRNMVFSCVLCCGMHSDYRQWKNQWPGNAPR